MSKAKKTTKVATFKGWGFIQPEGFVECADCPPSPEMDFACTSSGNVLWVNTFTRPEVGDKVILRKYKTDWVMTGYAS